MAILIKTRNHTISFRAEMNCSTDTTKGNYFRAHILDGDVTDKLLHCVYVLCFAHPGY